MKDILSLAASLLQYKTGLAALIMSLEAEDVRKGRLILQERVITEDLREAVFDLSRNMITDYRVQFRRDRILLRAEAVIRQLGPLTLEYEIQLREVRFNASGHKLLASFRENAVPHGSMAQKLAVRAAQLNGPLLKTAARLLSKPLLHVDDRHLLIDLDQIPTIADLPGDLELRIGGCDDGQLTLLIYRL